MGAELSKFTEAPTGVIASWSGATMEVATAIDGLVYSIRVLSTSDPTHKQIAEPKLEFCWHFDSAGRVLKA